MVHYGPKKDAAQVRPPVCPKCGSHRTEIVDRTHDTQTIIVRCHACGERSIVSNEVAAKLLAVRH